MTEFNDMTLIGLTGMSGAGKTTVCGFFAESGVEIIDCDIISREVVKGGSLCLTELCRVFSLGILTDGELDRRRLAGIVFSDSDALKQLNDTIYPYICYAVYKRARALYTRGKRVALLDAPTLFESGSDDFCDVIVSVVCDRELSVSRITERDKITAEEAENRLNSQKCADYFRGASDYCIENNGDTDELKRSVLRILDRVGVNNVNKKRI